MSIERTSSFIFLLSLCLAACGGGRPTGDSMAVDMGTTPVDMGSTPVDMGSTPVDMGSTPVDMGPVDVDLGTPGTDSGASGACTNATDQATLMTIDAGAITGMCASDNFGGEPATQNCIRSMTGLSNACADCFDGEVRCSVMNCALRCFSDTPDCAACRAMYCDAAFASCSGLTP